MMLFAEMSDIVWTAIIAAGGSACGILLTVGLPLAAGLVTLWLKQDKTSEALNGKLDDIKKVTAAANLAEGVRQGRAALQAENDAKTAAVAAATRSQLPLPTNGGHAPPTPVQVVNQPSEAVPVDGKIKVVDEPQK